MNTDSEIHTGTTLYSQLMRFMTAVFILILSGLFGGYWQSTRVFVERQLASHAQDAASSLALALPVAIHTGDMQLAEITVMPLFDRGYYRSIVVRGTDGKVLFERQLKNDGATNIPKWFKKIADLKPPAKQAVVSSGWRQLGFVEVMSEPRFAYEQLWDSSLQVLLWMLLIAALSGIGARFWLRSILIPLNSLEQAAQEVARRRFHKVLLKPRSIELRRLVAGFNSLVDAVQTLLGHEEARAERFLKESLTDQMTGMLNRKGLASYVHEGISEKSWLGIIECHDLANVNQTSGKEAGNKLILLLGQAIKSCFSDGVIARLSASGFAVIMHDTESEEHIKERCMAFHNVVGLSCSTIIEPLHIVAGWALRRQRNLGEWLTAADQALKQTVKDDLPGCFFEGAVDRGDAGYEVTAYGWGQLIRDALDLKRVRLYTQPTVFVDADGSRSVLHRELLTVLVDPNGEEKVAAQWIDVASRQGLLADVDRVVLEIMANTCLDVDDVVVMNLSAETWSRIDFVENLPQLAVRMKKWKKIIFELREEDVVNLPQPAEWFAQAARNAEFGVAIDHFGVSAGGVAALRRLLPEYIKLSPTLSEKIDTDAGSFYLESLVAIAATLDIRVFALTFEQEAYLSELQKLGIKGIQGNAVAARKPLDSRC